MEGMKNWTGTTVAGLNSNATRTVDSAYCCAMDSEQLIGLLLFSVFAVVAAYVFGALSSKPSPTARNGVHVEELRCLITTL